MSKSIIYITLLFILSACFKSEKADLVVHNAKIYTVNENFDIAQAMAIKNGKIIELGPEREILNRYNSNETIDARGMAVYPGFIDAHSHFSGYALGLSELNLYGSKSFDEVIERATKFQKENKREWLIGRGWDQTAWENSEFPNKEKLDQLFPDTPVLLMRIDGHAILVNSKALEIAGIDETTTVQGGAIDKDEDGQLTGILIDNAQRLVNEKIPAADKTIFTKLMKEAEKNCFELGLTTVTDAGIDKDRVEFYDALHESGDLKIRIYGMLNPTEENEFYFGNGPIKKDRLNISSFKLYCDGALGSRGAALKEPYADDPKNSGLILYDKEFYESYAKKGIESGFQINTHCIGDSAASLILNVYADALKGVNDNRWRIEHAQIIDPADLHFFRDFSIIPSVQPTHAISDMDWAEERLGKKRIDNAYIYNTLKNQLGIIALGTDFPVEGLSPIKTFYTAVFRKNSNGKPEDGYKIDESLSREDALRGMTIWAALASFEEENRGSLEVDKNADFVILNHDLMKARESDILKSEIMLTCINGETVYSLPGFKK